MRDQKLGKRKARALVGAMFNAMYVRSDANGKVIGHFTLYNVIGFRDPKCANHAMSAIRYGLTTFAQAGRMYDPGKSERDQLHVVVTRRRLAKNQSR